MNIGEQIKNARKMKNMTQRQLAEKINKAFSSIQKYELGITQPPIDVIKDIATALEVPISYFFPPIDPSDPEDAKTFGRYIKDGKVELPGLVDGNNMEEVERREELNASFSKLNETGRKTAVERVEELTKIPEYQKKK